MATQIELRKYAHILQKIFVDNMFIRAESAWNSFKAFLHADNIRINSELKLFKKEFFKCLDPKSITYTVNITQHKKLIKKYCGPTASPDISDNLLKIIQFRVPTIKFLIDELSDLQKDFSNLKLVDNKLSISTKNIVLEGIYFGPFNISLDIRSMSGANNHSYHWWPEIKALDPQYPGDYSDSQYTHPHVGNSICLGDGEDLIYNAAHQGRIFDYFQLINTVLNTYGSDPYEQIESWEGVRCNDCADYFAQDDGVYCNKCSSYSCEYCIKNCNKCQESKCALCYEMAGCDYCGTINCDSCVEKCSQCNNDICGSCLSKCESCEDKLCSNCNKPCDLCGLTYHSNCEYICCEKDD